MDKVVLHVRIKKQQAGTVVKSQSKQVTLRGKENITLLKDKTEKDNQKSWKCYLFLDISSELVRRNKISMIANCYLLSAIIRLYI